ncbi:MAG: hypothetical protein NTZ74_12230 [Chloroflexi bacterium]|nr:hypothetical protein [Chloroflexota bacterium]
MASGHGQLFFNPWMNYPEGWNLSTTDTALASALPGVLFSVFLGPIAGYNFAMLITFVLSGFFMYLWVKDLTNNEGAALIAGTMFAFLPYRTAHFLAGHLNLSGTQWFPLYFYGVYHLLKSGQKFSLKWILVTVFAVGAIGFTSMYYLYMTLILSIVFVGAYLLFSKFDILSKKYFWLNMACTMLLSVPLLVASIKPFIDLSHTGVIVERALEYVSTYSASPTDFFLPASSHFIFGKIVGQYFNRDLWIEGSLYLSVTGIILSLVALFACRHSEKKPLIYAAWICVIVSIILSLGINLHWNNENVIWKVPDLIRPWIGQEQTYIYLPSYWLFFHLPFFNSMRAIMRFGVFALVFIPVLSGFGFQWIQRKFSAKISALFTVLILGLLLFEFYPGSYANQLSEPAPREVDLWLAAQPDQGVVVQFPIQESSDVSQTFYTMFYNKPFVGGFFNAYTPVQFSAIESTLSNFPDEGSIDLLKKLFVKYMVVDSSAYPNFNEIQEKMDSYGLVLLTIKNNEYVFSFK